ncbi:hypothetical protein IFR05_013111 [Cadophora sp. M221]|nr:hypothetical protein IFR05_013111 [Cadophora sp. M221]
MPAHPTIPNELTPYLTLLAHPPNPPLPICIECQAAVLPKSLLDHLRKHHSLPLELRSSVRSFVASVPNPLLDFGDVVCNVDGSEPMGKLKVVDAWRCRVVVRVERQLEDERMGESEEGGRESVCGFIRRDVTDVRRHVNLVHGVGAAGRYEACKAQSWFGGRRAVYWRVCGDGGGDGECDVVMSNERVEGGKISRIESSLVDNGMDEKRDRDKDWREQRKGDERGGEPKRVETSIFTSICRWGFYGKGFGDKTPKSWREGEERELGIGMMF